VTTTTIIPEFFNVGFHFLGIFTIIISTMPTGNFVATRVFMTTFRLIMAEEKYFYDLTAVFGKTEGHMPWFRIAAEGFKPRCGYDAAKEAWPVSIHGHAPNFLAFVFFVLFIATSR
jgi:hypothetical protein